MAGRPPNPRSPEQLHERELLAWGGMAERVRKRIDIELDYFEALPTAPGPDGGNIDTHLLVAEMLMKLSTTISAIMERGQRLSQQRPARPDEDPDAIERELLGT